MESASLIAIASGIVVVENDTPTVMDCATHVAVKFSGPILLRVFHTKRQETSHVAETPNYIPLTKQTFMSQTTKFHYHPGKEAWEHTVHALFFQADAGA